VRKPAPWNLTALLIVLGGFGLVCLSYVESPPVYAALMKFWNVGIEAAPYRPFSDLSELLAAGVCVRGGQSIYPIDPCDTWHRSHNYPVMMGLWAHILPDPAWLPVIAIAQALLVFAIMARSCRIRSPAMAILLLMMLASPTIAFALERGNLDVAVFLLLSLAAFCARRSLLLGNAVTTIAGLLKYYPIVGIVVAMKARPVHAVALMAVPAIVFALYLQGARAELAQALPTVAIDGTLNSGWGGLEFFEIPAVIMGDDASPRITQIAGFTSCGVLALLVAWLAGQFRKRQKAPPGLTSYGELSFFIGGAVIAFLYVATSSLAYRGILFLMLAPYLFERLQADFIEDRRAARILLGLLAALLWMPALFGNAMGFTPRLIVFCVLKAPVWLFSLALIASILWSQAMRMPLVVLALRTILGPPAPPASTDTKETS
jgi:hypothetical protein